MLLETIIFYDTPQVFTALDQFGSTYLCLLVEEGDQQDKYLCTPASHTVLTNLTEGLLDLREVFEHPELTEYFVVQAESGDLSSMAASTIDPGSIPVSWLPDPGFRITPSQRPNIEVIQESLQRNRAVIHCSLNPPEAREDPKISVEHLSQAARLIQRLVRYAYRKALRDVSGITRETIQDPANYELQVFAFSRGSFTLHMQSSAPADLVGYAQIAKAFDIIDSVVNLIDDPESSVERVAQIGGHFATVYKELLAFVADSDTSIEYQWAMPEKKLPTSHRIGTVQAKPVYEAIARRVDIGIERITLSGRLTKVDEKYQNWRIVNDKDGKEYNGASDINLAGLVIETQKYLFECEERLEEERGTGKESARLFLISFKPL